MKFLRQFWYPLSCLVLSASIVGLRWAQIFTLPQIPVAFIAVPLSFMLGLGLNRTLFQTAIRNIRLQLGILFWIFAIFPLLFTLGFIIAGWWHPFFRQAEIRGILIAISVIPTTISSGVLMTANAKGNPATSLVTALSSNLSGTILSPLLLTILLQSSISIWSPELLWTSVRIITLIVIPFVIGQIIQPQKLRESIRAQKNIRMTCNILVLINISISTAQINAIDSLQKITGTAIMLLVWYPLMVGITVVASRLLRLSRDAEISLVIMGNQKTLSFGLVILALYFENQPEFLGQILFILILFNVWQFMVTGVAQSLYAKHANPTR